MPKLARGRRFRTSTTAAPVSPAPTDTGAAKQNDANLKSAAYLDWKKGSKHTVDVKSAVAPFLVSKTIAPAATSSGAKKSKDEVTRKPVPQTASLPAQKLEPQLSRGQRKRQAKREQYLRKERLVMSSLQLKKQDEQAKRIDGLDAIKEALLATVPTKESDESKKEDGRKPSLLKSNRGRKRLVEQEVTQMNLVLQHPAFIADPFATMREHLKNTIKPTVHKKREVPEKAKRKRKKSKVRVTRSKNR